MKNKKGFTLIELLVVIAIIGLLSTLAVVSLNGARSKARDARRTSDLKALQSAIELHIGDYEVAPAVPSVVENAWANIAVGAQASGKLTAYLPAGMPIDPSGTDDKRYVYCRDAAAGQSYVYLIGALLESTDANIAGDLDGAVASYVPNSGECIASDDARPSAIDCSDGANGNIDGKTSAAAFCLGKL